MIADGDIVNVDITAYIGGVHGDTNATFLAGNVDEESRLLVERTHEAMMRGIRAVAPGRPLNAIGRVIESYARRFGYGVVRDFTGHGIGTTFHSGLVVPALRRPGRRRVIMEPGMTFTIEPMLTLGTIEYDIWPDGWTAVTRDRKRTAQFEHTLAGHRGRLRDPHAAVAPLLGERLGHPAGAGVPRSAAPRAPRWACGAGAPSRSMPAQPGQLPRQVPGTARRAAPWPPA